jgi:hypothetical protein
MVSPSKEIEACLTSLSWSSFPLKRIDTKGLLVVIFRWLFLYFVWNLPPYTLSFELENYDLYIQAVNTSLRG